jgi:hypothetical protein
VDREAANSERTHDTEAPQEARASTPIVQGTPTALVRYHDITTVGGLGDIQHTDIPNLRGISRTAR